MDDQINRRTPLALTDSLAASVREIVAEDIDDAADPHQQERRMLADFERSHPATLDTASVALTRPSARGTLSRK